MWHSAPSHVALPPDGIGQATQSDPHAAASVMDTQVLPHRRVSGGHATSSVVGGEVAPVSDALTSVSPFAGSVELPAGSMELVPTELVPTELVAGSGAPVGLVPVVETSVAVIDEAVAAPLGP